MPKINTKVLRKALAELKKLGYSLSYFSARVDQHAPPVEDNTVRGWLDGTIEPTDHQILYIASVGRVSTEELLARPGNAKAGESKPSVQGIANANKARRVTKYVFELDNGYGDGGLMLESVTPFMPVNRGDLVHPAWFSAFGYTHPGPNIIYEVVKVEHILYPLGEDGICHQMLVIVREIKDDVDARVRNEGLATKS